MDATFEAALVECLDAFERGESLDRILARYPGQAGQLRPHLQTAALLATLEVQPPAEAQTASRQAFLGMAATLRDQRRKGGPSSFWGLRRLGVLLGGVALILLIAQVLLVWAAQSSLPGDRLYGFKQAAQNIRLSLAGDAEQRQALTDDFRAERREEVQALLALGRDTRIDFGGDLEAIHPDSWVLSGLTVPLNPNTTIAGEPVIGRYVHCYGRIENRELQAFLMVVSSE